MSNFSNIQLIIPMSGLGQRFITANYIDPKPLINIDGKSMIEHVYNMFPNTNDVTFICNEKHLKETKMQEILLSFCPHAKIIEVPVENRQGPVHAVSLIFDSINDDNEVIISYCDYATSWNYQDFLNITRTRTADGAIVCYTGFHPHMLGTDNYAFLREKEINEEKQWMAEIQEKKPFTTNRMNEYASNGTYYFKSGKILKKYFQLLMDIGEKVNNEYYVSMVYNLMVKDSLNVSIYKTDYMLQWGTPYDLEVYNMWSNYFRNIIKSQPLFTDTYDTTTLLPLAGHGSRFSHRGYSDPKPLLDINGLPMVVQAIKCLPQSTNNVFICLKEHCETYPLQQSLLNSYPDAKILTIDKVTEGQACTCEIGINQANIDLTKPLLITASDNGVYYNVAKYKQLLDDPSIDGIIWSFRHNPTSKINPQMYSWLEVDEQNILKRTHVKKCPFDNPYENHAIIGTMFFRKGQYFMDGLKNIYEKNIRANGEYYVDNILNELVDNGKKLVVFEVDNYVCWGTPDDYETYLYWQKFFNQCEWHPYKKENDITYNKNKINVK
jgi:NDP-sugar pyrophosphorylase family protein